MSQNEVLSIESSNAMKSSKSAHEDFHHIYEEKGWEEQCMDWDQTMEIVEVDQQKINDIRGGLNEWECVAHDDKVTFHHLPTDCHYNPTDHALKNICAVSNMSTWAAINLRETMVAKTKKGEDYTRGRADYEVLRDYINVHLFNGDRQDQQKERLFRTWRSDDAGEGTLRALLSNKYCIINNKWFLNAVREMIPKGLICHWKGNADTLFANVLIPDTMREEQDSDFGGMISIGNSEIGLRRISSLPSIFRAICMNGCIWDQKEGKAVSKVHRGQIDLVELRLKIQENLQAQIPLLNDGIDKLVELRFLKMNDVPIDNIFAQTAIENSLSKPEVSLIRNGYLTEEQILGEEVRTSYGLANAITRAGQELSPERWVQFDMIAGTMFRAGEARWESFLKRARDLTDEQIEKRIAV